MSPEMWGNFAHVPVPIMLPCCGHNWQELLGLWARLVSPSSVLGLQPKHVQEAQLSCRQALASNRAEGYQGIGAVAGEVKMRARTGTAEKGPCQLCTLPQSSCTSDQE